MEPKSNSAQPENVDIPVYDFSSPLWSKYYREIRKTVKFPRGYREISSLAHSKTSEDDV